MSRVEESGHHFPLPLEEREREVREGGREEVGMRDKIRQRGEGEGGEGEREREREERERERESTKRVTLFAPQRRTEE